MSYYMADHGARSLVYLSPSGESTHPDAAKMVAELRARGVQIDIVRGTATSQDDVCKAISLAPFPIHGAINAIMVLRVSQPPFFSRSLRVLTFG
jgi:hypothetical protein